MNQMAVMVNELLVNGYDKVQAIEQRMLAGMDNVDLSISELHILEFIGSGKETGRTIGDIAARVSKTPPSITVAVQKLERRGYVEKLRNERDGRVVHVVLTRLGRRTETAHKYFHRKMINDMLESMDEKERRMLIGALERLNRFFDESLSDMDAKAEKSAPAGAGRA